MNYPNLVASAEAIEIQTAAQCTEAKLMLKTLKAAVVEIDAHYKPLETAAKISIDKIRQMKKADRDPVVAARLRLEGMILGFVQSMETRRIEAAATHGGDITRSLALTASVPQEEAVRGIHGRKNWCALIIDAGKIPREWMIPDQKRLNVEAREKKEALNIPGVLAVYQEGLVVRDTENGS